VSLSRILGKSALTTVVFFLLAEVVLRTAYCARNALVTAIPLPYVVGDVYGPIPPWLDSLLILRDDPHLLWRNIGNTQRTYIDIFAPVWRDDDRVRLLRRFTPWLPAEFRTSSVWSIALNGDGFRSPPLSLSKPEGAIRIACLGDSWTFGMNVNQEQTYPSRLAEMLHERHPDTPVEVMNFGVLGYSSFQGLQLLKQRVLDMNPDAVLIGFGMNDSVVEGYRDRDMVASGATSWRDTVKSWIGPGELYKLLRYLALAIRFQPASISQALQPDPAPANDGTGSDSPSSTRDDYDGVGEWTRVSPEDYEANIREMIALAREREARVVLLDNELWEGSPYRRILATISRTEKVPLVDSLRLVHDAKASVVSGLERRFSLKPGERTTASPRARSSSPPTEQAVIFRLYQDSHVVTHAFSIVAIDPELGGGVPNTVLLHDDGKEGDERAGDGVWSYRTTLTVGSRVRYVYTNSGRPGEWEGLDVPHIRELRVGASGDDGPLYLPVETFGKIYMQADNWHTDSAGYELIARAAYQALETRNR
jgi:lysophospholipase L1-like esterase